MPIKDSSKIISRDDFKNMITNNDRIIVVKFGAEWCKPCKQIDNYVNELMKITEENVDCYIIDIDEAFDVYGFLKQKKIVTSIPTILLYINEDAHPLAPEDIVTGTDTNNIKTLFDNANNFARVMIN